MAKKKLGFALISFSLIITPLSNVVQAEGNYDSTNGQVSVIGESQEENNENIIIEIEENTDKEETTVIEDKDSYPPKEETLGEQKEEQVIPDDKEEIEPQSVNERKIESNSLDVENQTEEQFSEPEGRDVGTNSEEVTMLTSSSESVVVNEDTKFYLNNENQLVYAEVYSGGNLLEIREYYSNSSIEDADKKIKYRFKLDSNGYIVSASQLDEQTQRINKHYEYYPQTVYGEHGNNIKYLFNLNHRSGYLTNASLREKGTQRILSVYEYYPNTSYGPHGKNIKFQFNLNDSGDLTSASMRENATQRVLTIYEYYSNTSYGTHGKNIKYLFNLNRTGALTNASLREKGTQRVLTVYEYYPNTSYGSHGKNIKFLFNLTPHSGYLTNASLREKGSQRILSIYEYYPGTTYGSHGKNIKFLFNLNGATGAITKASKREKGTQQILTTYEYYSNTSYGNHGSRISGVKLNVPLVSQLPELPTGCEITAVTMMLQYKGAKADKVKLAKEMPRHPWDPNYGYVGDPFTKRGWTIYPSALTGLVKKYAGSAEILTGKSNASIEKYLFNNKPVVVWVSPMHGFSVHALVLTGYDQHSYYFNDPWTGKKEVKMAKSDFNKIWSNQSKRAISY
ncbi:C39 family peptidase [Mesobacillus maritimus]|uniref:C39 family peptidase n=1 Tax=Mesobacillus maritimus TaxID=1643336 RepID=UPI0038514989